MGRVFYYLVSAGSREGPSGRMPTGGGRSLGGQGSRPGADARSAILYSQGRGTGRWWGRAANARWSECAGFFCNQPFLLIYMCIPIHVANTDYSKRHISFIPSTEYFHSHESSVTILFPQCTDTFSLSVLAHISLTSPPPSSKLSQSDATASLFALRLGVIARMA